MEISPLLLLLLLLLLILIVALISWSSFSSRRIKLPPSPPSWPLLGHSHLFPHLLSSSFISSQKEKLGPVFALSFGRVHFIFVASAALTHEALLQKGSIFAARPRIPSRKIFTSSFHGVSSSDGPYWRFMRRNLVSGTLSPSNTLGFKHSRNEVLDRMIARFRQSLIASAPVPVHEFCRSAMFELLLFMCFGFFPDASTISHVSSMLHETLSYSQKSAPSDFFPVLHFLDGFLLRKKRAVRAKQEKLFMSLIDRHQKLAKLGELTPGNYLETLFALQNEDSSTQLSMDKMVTLCSEFLVGGVDTTVATIEWTMAHLVENPLIQAKIHEEICEVIGDKDRLIGEEDLPNLPYLQATITETLRLHPPGHVTLPHSVSQPCKLGGYDIMPGMPVYFSVTAISRDPEIWDEPLEYRPERMLSRDVDLTGTNKITMLPFSVGRRICPGLGVATIHLQLFIARMVQEFKWCTSHPGEIVDLSEKFEFAWIMKNPLKAVIRDRSRGPN